jgi:hypothetical protein
MVVKRLLYASLGGAVTFIGVVIANPGGFTLPALGPRVAGTGTAATSMVTAQSTTDWTAAVIAIVAAILAAAVVFVRLSWKQEAPPPGRTDSENAPVFRSPGVPSPAGAASAAPATHLSLGGDKHVEAT